MNNNLYIFITIFILISCYNIKGTDTQTISLIIAPSSYVVINGNTNISSFDCNYSGYYSGPINVEFIRQNNKIKIENAELSIPVEYIDCHNPFMNNDLRKLLSAGNTHDIIINISDFYEKKIIHDKPGPYIAGHGSANINVSIAGVKNQYEVEFVDRIKGNELTITSTLKLDLHDFGLTPPRIMFGAIELKNTVTIDILLKLLIQSAQQINTADIAAN
jgi:hypothetical protein